MSQSREKYQWILARAYWMLVFVIAFGYLKWSGTFARIGIPVGFHPSNDDLEIDVYIFELFLLFSTFFAIFVFRNQIFELLKLPKLNLHLLVALILTISGLRLTYDLFNYPLISVLRQSAFSWYLLLPLVVSCIPLWKKGIEIGTMLLFAWSLWGLGVGVVDGIDMNSGHRWVASLGLVAPIALAVSIQKFRPVAFLVIALIGFALGESFITKVQRTTFLGIVFGIAWATWFFRDRKKTIFFRTIVLIAISISSFLFANSNPDWRYSIKRSVLKAQTVKPGVEGFRYFMWKDAFDKFIQHPVMGIGFGPQVVDRIYIGNGAFVPNDGFYEEGHKSPISGPHNSYLNALARMGGLGALFLILHALAFFYLAKAKFYFLAGALAGQCIYAAFNVGLEGPARSFLLLIGLGVAMRIERDKLNESSVRT